MGKAAEEGNRNSTAAQSREEGSKHNLKKVELKTKDGRRNAAWCRKVTTKTERKGFPMHTTTAEGRKKIYTTNWVGLAHRTSDGVS